MARSRRTDVAVAYASNESGQFEIYVDSFPKPGARLRVTTAGGTEPRWRGDGSALYLPPRFRSPRGSPVAVATRARGGLAGAPVRCRRCRFARSTSRRDGRFLLNLPAARTRRAGDIVASNWSGLRGYVSANSK